MPASLQEYLVDLGLAVAVGVACLFLAGLVAHVLPPLLSWLAFGVPAVAALLLDRGGRRSKTMAGGSLLCLWLVLALVIRALVAG